MNCPGCGAGMDALEFERQPLGTVTLDFCFPCQVIWFDTLESQQLTPGAVLQVFKTLSERQPAARSPLPALLACPRCEARLGLTHDLQHTTRFTYFRCEFGHGHLSPFFQFLLEKNFVRPITGAELADLKAKVKTIQCSNCGAPLDLERDTACRYCGSPISILDPEAVAKTVSTLTSVQQRQSSIDVDQLATALLMRPPPDDSHPHLVGDLVSIGIAAVAALLRSRA
ncbi:MAG TPA: zinc ribbon domain-containing protein [Casimicrobiaceae bacterium]|nr:zinc ribbon domain-containing protein [Casimicrobiaceae bacterium]